MLKAITINHYRCIEDLRLDFSDLNSVLLLGRNGAGKSTVMNVMSLFQRLSFGEVDVNRLFSLSDFAYGDVSRPICIGIEFENNGLSYSYQIAIENQGDKLVAKSEIVKCNETFVWNGREDDGSSSPKLSSGVLILPLIVGDDASDPLVQVRDSLRRLVIVSPQPSVMRAQAGLAGLRLLPDASNCIAWFDEIHGKNLGTSPKITSALKKLFSNEIESFSWKLQGGVKHLNIFFKHLDNTDIELDFDGLSDGEKCFVLASFLSVKVAEEKDVVCFWDEPDNYLAVSEVSRFITALKKMFRRNRGLLIVTSHNIEGIQTFGLDETIVISRNSHTNPPTVKLSTDIESDGVTFMRKILTGDIYNEQR